MNHLEADLETERILNRISWRDVPAHAWKQVLLCNFLLVMLAWNLAVFSFRFWPA